jgi:peptidyl-prolyl cis-trans isomerase A (cyclophilin A)
MSQRINSLARVACSVALLTLVGCSPAPTPGASSTPGGMTPNITFETPGNPPSETPSASASPSESPSASATPSGSPTPVGSSTPKPSAKTSRLEPLPGVSAPELKKVVKVSFKTDKGLILIELYPEAGPNAAKRFEELVKTGFYDNTPVFRIVPGFVAQFGINSDPKHVTWKDKLFNDDPSLFRLEKGTLAFAKAGPNSNSTQVFINYNDNSSALVPQNFTAFGKITKGMELAEGFKSVGDPSMGLSQDELWKNTQGYLKSLPEKPNMILKAEIVK